MDAPDEFYPTYPQNIATLKGMVESGVSTNVEIRKAATVSNDAAFNAWYIRTYNKYVGLHNRHNGNLKQQLETNSGLLFTTKGMDQAAENEANAAAQYRAILRVFRALYNINRTNFSDPVQWGTELNLSEFESLLLKCGVPQLSGEIPADEAAIRYYKASCMWQYVSQADEEAKRIYAAYKEIGAQLEKDIRNIDTTIKVLSAIKNCLHAVMNYLPGGKFVDSAITLAETCSRGTEEDCRKAAVDEAVRLAAATGRQKIGDATASRVKAIQGALFSSGPVQKALKNKVVQKVTEKAVDKIASEAANFATQQIFRENTDELVKDIQQSLGGSGEANREEKCVAALAAGADEVVKALQ